MVTIAAIVEGHGEVTAVPLLLRRLVVHLAPGVALSVEPPIRRSRDRLLKPGELEKDVELAAERLTGKTGAILILLDSEGDCPADLGPSILRRAVEARPDRIIRVALANREYEAWFLAAAASLAGKRGLDSAITAPADPEIVPGAKEWLRKRMVPGRTYSETADQPALTQVFDLELARRHAPSFDRLCRVCESLFQTLSHEDQN